MGRLVSVPGACLVLLLAAAAWGAEATFVDAVLGTVEGRVVAASDVAVARALGLFGFTPSTAPIAAADVERMLDAWLLVLDARQLDIGGAPEQVDAAWQAATERAGGAGALQRWLARAGLEPERTRALVADHARWRHFIDVRFRQFVFVLPEDLAAALGPGPHDPAAEARARQRLQAEQAEREMGAWLRERGERAERRRLLGDDGQVPLPFPMP
jgi:hypothetical protein